MMLRDQKRRADSGPLVLPNNHEEQRSADHDLKILLDGMPEAGSVINGGWLLPHTSTQGLLERQGRLTAAKRAVLTASRKSTLTTLLAHSPEEFAKLGLANRDLVTLRFAYLELLDMEIARYVVQTVHEFSKMLCPRELETREGRH